MGCNSDYSEYAEKIRKKLWKTKGSRFNASRRLNNKYNFSVFSISILSFFGICIPIIQKFIDSNQCSNVNELYTLTSILFSIFILILSLLEGSKNYQIKADRLYNNAVDISSILNKINFLIDYELKRHSSKDEKNKIIAKIKQHEKEYDSLIKQCSENHDPDDYSLFKAENHDNFIDKTDKKCTWSKIIPFRQFFSSKIVLIWLRIKYYWLYFALTAIIAIIIFNLYFSCPI